MNDKNNEKIETYKSQFYSALDDYKNADIAHKLNPDIEQYNSILMEAESHLTTINKDVFILTNDIQFNTDNLNKRINELNAQISDERGLWKHLGFNYQQVKGLGEGANVMIDNSQDQYKAQFISNWCIFIGIIILSIAIYLIFGKKIVVITSPIILKDTSIVHSITTRKH